jgi:transposase
MRGRVTEHHRFMLQMHLEQVEHLERAIRDVEARADQAPFQAATELLMTMPGVSEVTGRVIPAIPVPSTYASRPAAVPTRPS